MTTNSPDALIKEASAWWSTAIIDIHPDEIRVRGYPIQDLIGELRFPESGSNGEPRIGISGPGFRDYGG